MSIFQKLSKVQNELRVGKTKYNSFSNFYYRSCEDIFDAIKPVLMKHNMSLYMYDNIVIIGSRYYVEATAVLIDNEDGSTLQAKAYARETETKKGNDESQITGSASSYARKYALNGLFLLDDAKDPDSDDNRNKDNHKTATPNNTAVKIVLEEGTELYNRAVKYLSEGGDISRIESKYIISEKVKNKLLRDSQLKK